MAREGSKQKRKRRKRGLMIGWLGGNSISRGVYARQPFRVWWKRSSRRRSDPWLAGWLTWFLRTERYGLEIQEATQLHVVQHTLSAPRRECCAPRVRVAIDGSPWHGTIKMGMWGRPENSQVRSSRRNDDEARWSSFLRRDLIVP